MPYDHIPAQASHRTTLQHVGSSALPRTCRPRPTSSEVRSSTHLHLLSQTSLPPLPRARSSPKPRTAGKPPPLFPNPHPHPRAHSSDPGTGAALPAPRRPQAHSRSCRSGRGRGHCAAARNSRPRYRASGALDLRFYSRGQSLVGSAPFAAFSER